MIFELVEKTKQLYVFSIVIEYNLTTISNLWMSKGVHDIFALLIHFFEAYYPYTFRNHKYYR